MTKPKYPYKRHPDTVAALTQDEGILVCGAAGCPAALNLKATPAPKSVGWSLSHGWWLCPEHEQKVL